MTSACPYNMFLFIFQGMVEPGQVVTQALKAEFGEEAMAKLSVTEEEREKISRLVEKLFKNGVEVIFVMRNCQSHFSFRFQESLKPEGVLQFGGGGTSRKMGGGVRHAS